MAYPITDAGNPMAISERECGSAAAIMFTAFTSCFGVVVLHNGELTAVHLSMYAVDDSAFDVVAADNVLARLPAGYTKCMIIGCTSMWETTPAVRAGYLSLVGRLRHYTDKAYGNGTYGARIVGDAIAPTYEGQDDDD